MKTRVALLLTSFCCACGVVSRGSGQSFPQFVAIDHVEIRCNSHGVASVVDPASIDAMTKFANQHPDRWSTPWYGIPVPTVTLDFYSGKTFVGHFGSGAGFFETLRSGAFFSQDADAAALDQFKALVQSATNTPSLASCFGDRHAPAR